jgi:hypothetical protein
MRSISSRLSRAGESALFGSAADAIATPVCPDRRLLWRPDKAHYGFILFGRNYVLNDYLIERNIPGVELLSAEQYAEVRAKSNAVLDQLGSGIEWVSSLIVKDATFCHYRAKDEEIIQEHARISGFPANKISLITNVLSPKAEAS